MTWDGRIVPAMIVLVTAVTVILSSRLLWRRLNEYLLRAMARAVREALMEEGDDTMPELRCDICGKTYPGGSRGGHCRGGEYGGCCETFAGDGLADQHRVGPGTARRCLFPDEMIAKGWRKDERGIWHGKPIENAWWDKGEE